MNKYMKFRNMMTTTISGKEEAILNLGSWYASCTLRRSILIHHNHSKLLLILYKYSSTKSLYKHK